MEKPTLTIKEASKLFHMPQHAIRTLIKRKAFPVVQVGNRCYIVKQVFEDYLKSGGELYHAGD